MINVIRFVAMVGAVLLLSGCTTTDTVAGQPSPTRKYTLTVLESSYNRTLTPEETEQLRTRVLQYLLTQGPVRNDTYTVQVDFPAEAPGAAPEYMVVQLTAEAQPSYTVLTNYQEPWYYDPYFVGYSYFGLMGFAYYDQFYYDHSHYYRPIPPPGHSGRPHPPGVGYNKPRGPHDPGSGTPGVNRPPPQDPARYVGNPHYPNSTKPNGVRPPAGTDRTNRPPPTGVTQRQDPGNRTGGRPPSGSSAPVARTENPRGGGSRSAPPPSYSPPPARESAPARETTQASVATRGNASSLTQEQEK